MGNRFAMLRAAVPALLLVAAAGALMLAYNRATTGDMLKTPYSLNRETYAVAPAFLISPPVVSQQRGPAYFRDFYAAEAKDYLRRETTTRKVGGVLGKLFYSWNFYVGATLTIAFLAGLRQVRRNWFLPGTLLFFYAGYVLETWNFPHYTAAVFPVFLILTMMGFGWLRGWQWRGRPVGLFLTRAMPAAMILLLLLPLSSVVTGRPALVTNLSSHVCCALADGNLRNTLIARLIESPGRDLVLVRDNAHNPIHYEMVYNEADIDNSPIVWARRLDAQQDIGLLQYFAGRKVWNFEWAPDTPAGYRMVPVDP